MANKRNKDKARAKRQVNQLTEILEAKLIDEPTLRIRSVSTIPMFDIVLKAVMAGSCTRTIKDLLKSSGFDCGDNKVQYLMREAKLEITEKASKDFDTNYAWVQANLLELHEKAVKTADDKMRLVIIKELCSLWGLNKQTIEIKETNITPEMIEQFEQALLR